jgi:integrase
LVPRRSKYVFPGRLHDPLNRTTMAYMLGRLHGDITMHGFRSTFKDWAAETTNHQNFVVEMALAHAIPNSVEAAYRRGDLLMKRIALMEDWNDFCAGAQPAARSEAVTSASEVLRQT